MWARIARAFSMERLIGLAMIAAFVVLYYYDPYPVQFMRIKTFDYYQQVKPREIPAPAQKPVTIIDLDENSLAEIGQWPWPRNIIAQMIENLMQMGAVLVAFDMAFPEPDRMNPASIAENLPGLDDATRAMLRKLPSNDQILADVIKKSRVVLGQAGFWEVREVDKTGPPPIKKSIALKGSRPHKLIPEFQSLVRNVSVFEKPAAGHGIFTVVPETDGIVRRVPTIFTYKGDIYPALSVEMLRVAFNRKTTLVTTKPHGVESIGIVSKRIYPPNGLIIPTDRNGRVWPYFSKRDKAKYVSARDVLAGTADPALIKGKLTIVGTSAVGLLDIRSTPVDPVIPGVEIHAQLIEAALHNTYLSRPGWFDAAEMFMVIVGGLLMVVLVPWIGAKWTVALLAVVSVGAAGMSWYLFVEYLFLFDAGFAIVTTFLLYSTLTYTSYAKEETQRRQTRNAFSKYLSPDMVERVAGDPSSLKLGGEQRDLT
ncbi:MAG TPA: CHASE2 domain-containing protein, partial [Rhodospirillales bacterium]|nr:CHASE2 domain-containing protein [Rhodospirillales bacterium]